MHSVFLLSDRKRTLGKKLCIKDPGRKKVKDIPESSIIFSACLCSRPITSPGSSSAPMTDSFTIYSTPFFFASFTKLEEISVMLEAGNVSKNSLSTLFRALAIVSGLF